MKKVALIVALSIGMFGYSQYNTAIGLRGGETIGFTVKQFVGSTVALEGILGVWDDGVSGTLLVEKYVPAFNAAGLNFYFGGGGHLAAANRHYYRWYSYNSNDRRYVEQTGVGVGLDGIVGLEYKIPRAPVAFSLDLKPYVEFGPYGTWGSLDPGLGVKVAF